jgi:hypothetical protein
LQSVQWSALITAALLVPSLLPFALVKPQLGIALVASGRWSPRTIGVTVLLLLVSVLIWPAWPVEWITHGNLATFNGRSPVMVLPGIVLLLAAAAWRAREGRLLLAMSVVVQRYLYDQLPLYLVARTAKQMLLLLATSWTGVAIALGLRWFDPMAGLQLDGVWRLILVTLFLPALGVVLYNEKLAKRGPAREG